MYNFPTYSYAHGVRLPFGTILGPSSHVVAYVRSTGAANLPAEVAKLTVSTLNAGLAMATSGRGDVVIVLPGHTENISAADQMSSLVAGTKIIGVGYGTERGTFTWTAATSTFLLDVANVTVQNLILNMDPGSGSVNVAAPITISAAGCRIIGNTIRMGTDANSLVTIGITTTAPADDCEISDNLIYGATAAECTTMIRLVGADRMRMSNNYIVGATSSTTVGVLQFLTTASTNVVSENNVYRNNKALSVHAVTGMAGISGVSRNDHFVKLDTATLTGIVTPGDMTVHRGTIANTTGETGSEVVGTVSA